MKLQIKFIVVFFLLLIGQVATCPYSNAQTATAKFSKNDILVGDQIRLTFEFQGPADINMNFPMLNDTITKNIEIVNSSEIKTALSADKKQKTFQQVLTVTSFDSGYFAVRPFRFSYTQGKDTSRHYLETQPMLLVVMPLKVDAQKGIRDIKGPLEARFTFMDALPYIIGFLVLCLVAFFLFYYLRKKKKKEPIFQFAAKPKLPAHEIALNALEDLRNKKLWQNDQVKQFHSELTDIVRQYIEDRFGIPALEMVSEDISEAISRLEIDNKTKTELKEMLGLADMVKFAKANPLPSEHDRSFNNAIEFVKNTIIQLTIN